MNRRPLVALTTSTDQKGGGHSRPSVFLYTRYIAALEAIGVTPVLITPAHSRESIAALMSSCRGLVLSGGEDVDPARYGEAPSPALGTITPERDEMEFNALACALGNGIPVFAICRGLQVLNVFLGGSLYQDIATEFANEILHQQRTPWSTKAHAVSVERGTMLHDIVGADTFSINSFHHQALKDVAPGLRVAARAEDGLIEAAESVDGTWCLGVQWHPERYEAGAALTDPDRRLFAAFHDVVVNGTH